MVGFFAFVGVFISLSFILFVTVHRDTKFPVNVSWDNRYSDSDNNEACKGTIPTRTRQFKAMGRYGARRRNVMAVKLAALYIHNVRRTQLTPVPIKAETRREQNYATVVQLCLCPHSLAPS